MLQYIYHEFLSDNDIRQVVLQCNYELKIYGFISSKRFMHMWINENLNNDSIANEYNNIILKWNNFCNLLLKFGFNKKYESLKLVKEYVYTLMEEERILLQKILLEISE